MAEQTVSDVPVGFEAAIDDETVERMEKNAQSKARGQQRRCALVATARDSQTLLKLANESPEAFEEMAGMVLDYREFVKAQLDLADAAVARIILVHNLSEAA
jgi:hypothetical protein